MDLRLPEGSSFAATLEQAKKLETLLDSEPGVEHYVTYVGSGSPRFYLPLDQQLTQSNFAQFVLVAKSNAERERVRERLLTLFANDFPGLRGRVSPSVEMRGSSGGRLNAGSRPVVGPNPAPRPSRRAARSS